METSPRIFISYSRADGRAFAEAFEHRLEVDAAIRSWRDLKSMGSGDIRPQVLRAIEQSQHLVLILSRRALASDWVKREWTHARMWGRMVSPVLADPTLQRADLPGWMRRSEVFDVADPERWQMLRQALLGSGETRRVSYMAGDLAEDFVARPAEYARLKQAVLSAGSDNAVALTTALRGAGGYGKTTLANYLCRDPDIRFEFSDGILRVDIGKERGDVTGLVIDLIEKLDPQAKRPAFHDVQTAAEHLGELIGEARLLLVIDDVWREAQLRPFLRGGPNCVRLVTTRLPQVLPAAHVAIPIDEMRSAEAASLIGANLPLAGDPAAGGTLATLAERLGCWAQMLCIANGWLRANVAAGQPLREAIASFEERLATRGLTGFDPEHETERNRAISACVEASLEEFADTQLARLSELAILPEDETVPLGIVEALWAQTGRLDEYQAGDLVLRLQALSLLQSLDLRARTLRLHDNMIWYLRDRIGPDGYRAAHAAMVQALRARCGGQWDALPATDDYGWRFLTRHLRGAGEDTETNRLLTDYPWIKAKLHASNARHLFDDYLPESRDEGTRLIGRAIALSLPALAASPRELPRQLFGRLGGIDHRTAAAVVAAARQDVDFRPVPRWPGLTPPGAERLRLVGHLAALYGAAFSPDGTRIVTASADRTARIWSTTAGQELVLLRGHREWVRSAAFSADGARIVTASGDRTARIWNGTTGEELAIFEGHESRVLCARFSPDGARIIAGLADGTARLWDADSGAELRSFTGHEDLVLGTAFSPDGARIVTAGRDGTARLWDATTGQVIAVLNGHADAVGTAAFSPDGARVVTASEDRTARTWDAVTGRELAVLRGHRNVVESAAFSPGGDRIVTGSWDRTARLWDAATGREIAVLTGHEHRLRSACFSPHGARIVTASDDGTARIWDAAPGQATAPLHGHEGWLRSASFSPDGTRIITASFDRTAGLWDATNGHRIAALRGHDHWVQSAAFSPDGARVVTASFDRTARLWDARTGEHLATLRGHTGSVRGAAFAADSTRIVTASEDCTARLWDAATGELRTILQGHEDWVLSASFSPDGARVVTTSEDRTARFWDAATGQQLATLRGHEGWVLGASFSPDGNRVATTSRDRTARLWDAASARELAVLSGHGNWILAAGFAPGSAVVVTASRDATARVWDAVTGHERVVLRGHEDWVGSVAFSRDGARIVTASEDRTARIWDTATGQELVRIALDAAVTGLSVHGGAIALGDALGRIHVFDADEFLGAEAVVAHGG
ncbi:MAG TPA: TIR domain-containing protein [Acetobacteraceae bacterium]